MRPYFLRDVWASATRSTPASGYAWPSTVGGRFGVRLLDERLKKGRQLLHDVGLDEIAECLQADPLATATALAIRLAKIPPNPQQEE